MASTFGGLAGEVVRQFTRLNTLPTTIPTLVVTLGLGFVSLILCAKLSIPGPFAWLVTLIAIAPVVGRFGLAARTCHFEGGFFATESKGEIVPFTLRYAALALAWGGPLGLLASMLMQDTSFEAFELGGGFGSFNSAKAVLLVVVTLLNGIVWLVAPTLSLIISLSADTVGEVFEKDRWLWLFQQRGADLPAFYAALIGGMTLFFAMALPVLLAIDVVLFAVNIKLGAVFAPLTLALPFSGIPVVMGRLAGAFVAAELPHAETSEAEKRRIPIVPEPSSLSTTAAEASLAETTQFVGTDNQASQGVIDEASTAQVDAFVKKIRQNRVVPDDLEALLTEGMSLYEHQPRHVVLMAVLVDLHLRCGKIDHALALGSHAIPLSLDGGATLLAVELYQKLVEERRRLAMDSDNFERLARVLLTRDLYHDSAWCFLAAAKKGADPMRAQKGIIAVADSAAKKGHHRDAVAFYDYFVATFPDSSFCDYCRSAAQPLRVGTHPQVD